VRGRTLTLRDLNRATLARQLLLERRKLSPLVAIERLVGMQAQWPPAPYVGLWTRVDGFRRATLERAVQRGDVVKPTVMRGTLHLVTARDYPLFYEYFHGDNGAGLGASHQTGWTGLVARMLHLFATMTPEVALATGKNTPIQSVIRPQLQAVIASE